MKPGAIISRAEALQILRNDLRRQAVERRAAELNGAGPQRREAILAEIEHEIGKEVRRRLWKSRFRLAG